MTAELEAVLDAEQPMTYAAESVDQATGADWHATITGAKAKQTKIARQLKYTSPGGDLTRLQAELQAARSGEDAAYAPVLEQDEALHDE